MFKKPLNILILAIIIAAVAFGLYQILRGFPFFAPDRSHLKEPKRIGIIFPRQHIEAVQGFKEGFKNMGYANVSFEDKGVFTSSPTLPLDIENSARELIRDKVDLIFATQENIALAALEIEKETGSDIPIVFSSRFHDPVAYGVIKSFKSSGNNATGISINLVEVVQKHLEFLRAINPAIKKIGVFGSGFVVPDVGDKFLEEVKNQGKKQGFDIVEYKTTTAPPGAESAWYQTAGKIKAGDIDAIYHIAGHFFEAQETAETELASRLRIPMVAPLEDLPTGGHFGYAGDLTASGEQASRIADKIFGGAKPSDIPIDFEEKNILVLYTKRAIDDGIVFPDSMARIANVKIEK